MGMKRLLPEELAEMLQDSLGDGFEVRKVSRAAFDIYRLYGLRLTPEMDSILLMLTAMQEGPEFELSEVEFQKLVAELRAK